MAAEKVPELDWLPAGWTVQSKVRNSGRKVKYYTNMETGKILYSKNEVIRYIKTGSSRCIMPQPINRCINRDSTKKHMQLLAKTNESPEGLPSGWIVELKTRTGGSRMGMKFKVYIDPSTGHKFYSKPQVTRYLKKLESYTSKQQKRVTDLHSASNVVVEKVAPDRLPPGWKLEMKIRKNSIGNRRDPFYTDPVTGYVFRSRKDVFRYLETGVISRHAFKPKKRGINNPELIDNEISPPSAAQRQKLTHHAARRRLFSGKGSSDMSYLALPEAEASRKRRGTGVSAETPQTSAPTAEIIQEKHSLEDVTGEHAETMGNSDRSSSVLPKPRGCKRKQGRRDFDKEPVSTPVVDVVQENKLPGNPTEKHAETKETSDPSSSALLKASSFRRKQGKRVFDEDGPISTPVADVVQDKKLPGNATEKRAETKGSSDPSRSALPKARGFKRKQGERFFDKSGPVTNPAVDVVLEKKFPGNEIEKNSNRKTLISSINSKKTRELNMPCRSSKRLAGLEPELATNSGFSERALRVAARKSGGSEAVPALGVALDNAAHGASKQLDAEPEAQLAFNAFRGMEAPLDEEASSKGKNPLEDQVVAVEQSENLEPEKNDEKKSEPQPIFPLGDFWSDPCLEFAFKTLTGAIPVDDNLEIQGFFQQLNTSPAQGDGCSTLSDFGLPGTFQSDISTHFDSLEKPVPRQQLPVNPSVLAPGNVSLPSCSGIAPQQPTLEGGKNNQRKVH